MKAYLSVCTLYKDEARYLPEWLEFHRLMGVERFFLYNNNSTDDHMQVLAPYIEEGTVVQRDWPLFPGQYEAFRECLKDHSDDSRWIVFHDLDEFLFSPGGRQLPDILRDFEEYPGVVVNSIFYGTSGHETPPEGLVIENYTRRIALAAGRNRIVKSIINPARTVTTGNVSHYFRYVDRKKAVNENREAVAGESTREVSVNLLRINHYFTRSRQERLHKIWTPRVHTGVLLPRPEEAEARDERLNEEVDEILVPYAPAVRAALAARAAGTPLPVGSLEIALAQG